MYSQHEVQDPPRDVSARLMTANAGLSMFRELSRRITCCSSPTSVSSGNAIWLALAMSQLVPIRIVLTWVGNTLHHLLRQMPLLSGACVLIHSSQGFIRGRVYRERSSPWKNPFNDSIRNTSSTWILIGEYGEESAFTVDARYSRQRHAIHQSFL